MPEQLDTTPLYTFRVHWIKGLLSPVRWMSQKLVVFRTKVILKTGLLNREERIIPISKITDIRVNKGCTAGVLGYGNLYIETAGSSRTEIEVIDIANPDYARDLIVHLVDQSEA